MASSPSQGTIVGSCGGSGKNTMTTATTAMGRAQERKIRCISVGGGGRGGGSIYIGHDGMVTWDAEGCCRVEKIVMELRRCRGSVVAKNLPDQSVIRSFFCYVLGTVSKHRQYGSWRHGASPWQKTLHFRVLFQNFNTAIW